MEPRARVTVGEEEEGGQLHLEKLNTGEGIAGISAIMLFISMFFDWFVVEIPDSSGVDFFLDGTGQSAWNSLDFIPIVLAIAIAVTLVVVVLRLSGSPYQIPVRANVVVAILGFISALLIIFRIVDPPSFGSFRGFFGAVSAERTVRFGIFLGLLAAAGIAFGGYRAMKEEGISSADLRKERGRHRAR
jgi:hypothetical protein